MKKLPFFGFFTVGLFSLVSSRAQTVISGGGNAITGPNFYLGTHSPSPAGLILNYDNTLANGVVVTFHANQLAAWLWENGTGTATPTTWPSMKLDLSNNLILYNGNNEGARLDPTNGGKLILGGSTGATLTAIGSALSTNGTFTAGGNVNFIGADGSLALSSSGVALSAVGGGKNITFTTPVGSGDIVFNTSGAERARIKSSGYVGIGTANPTRLLSINGASNAYLGFKVADVLQSTIGSDANGDFFIFDDQTSTYRMVVNTAGNVGIGTTTPHTVLEVGGRTTFLDGNRYWSLGAGRADGSGNGFPDSAAAVDGTFAIRDVWMQRDRLRIDAAGNVGIGTTTPSYLLHVNGQGRANSWVVANPLYAGQLALGVGANYEPALSSDTNLIVQAGNGANVIAKVGSMEAMRVMSDGNVGIGTTAPYSFGAGSKLLTVAGTTSYGGIITATNSVLGQLWANEGGAGAVYFGSRSNHTVLFTVNNVERARIDTAGNVGIGTTNPTQKLSVAGTIRAYAVVVDTGWSDYVFEQDYRLAPLSEVEAHIKEHKHLPGIPSAAEVAEHGVSLGDMQSKLLAKIEELTLRQIAQEKQLNTQAARIAQLERENHTLRTTQP